MIINLRRRFAPTRPVCSGFGGRFHRNTQAIHDAKEDLARSLIQDIRTAQNDNQLDTECCQRLKAGIWQHLERGELDVTHYKHLNEMLLECLPEERGYN